MVEDDALRLAHQPVVRRVLASGVLLYALVDGPSWREDAGQVRHLAQQDVIDAPELCVFICVGGRGAAESRQVKWMHSDVDG